MTTRPITDAEALEWHRHLESSTPPGKAEMREWLGRLLEERKLLRFATEGILPQPTNGQTLTFDNGHLVLVGENGHWVMRGKP